MVDASDAHRQNTFPQKKEQTMKNSRLVAYALGVIMTAAVLAGCSTGSGLNPTVATAQNAASSPAHAAGFSMSSTTPPLTAVSLALGRGATDPRDSKARPQTTRRHPCPNVHSYVAFYCPNFRQCGLWQWTCACACVPTKFLGWPVAPNPWNVSAMQAKCSACGPAHWAASQTTSSNVNEIALASKSFKPLGELTNGINTVALGVAQDPRGNLYIGQVGTNQILVYAAGSTYPTETLTEPNISNVYYLATDKAGDLFVDGWAYGSSETAFEVDELKAGSATFSRLNVTGTFPGGLAIDKKQNLWVDDQGNGTSGTISQYAPPSYAKLRTSFSYAGDNTEISIDSTNTQLVAANNFVQGSSVYSGGVVYSIPSGKVLSSATPTLGIMYGICFKKPTQI
jgi:hypothetical protein